MRYANFAADCCKSVVSARQRRRRQAKRAGATGENDLGQPERPSGSNPGHDGAPETETSEMSSGACREPYCLTKFVGNWIPGLPTLHRDDASFPSFPWKREPSGVRGATAVVPVEAGTTRLFPIAATPCVGRLATPGGSRSASFALAQNRDVACRPQTLTRNSLPIPTLGVGRPATSGLRNAASSTLTRSTCRESAADVDS
jgi:hypothetical protein